MEYMQTFLHHGLIWLKIEIAKEVHGNLPYQFSTVSVKQNMECVEWNVPFMVLCKPDSIYGSVQLKVGIA
jgi:hypothetical protein